MKKSFDSNVKVGQGNKTAVVLLLIFKEVILNPATNLLLKLYL
jgi:hypothetical protein